MYLFDEYVERHRIKQPFVRYTNWTAFIDNSTNNKIYCSNCNDFHIANWMVSTVTWQNSIRSSPGVFRINDMIPLHNGLDLHIVNDDFLQWDEYEDYILEWSKENGSKIITNEIEIKLAGWEMFLICMDGELAGLIHESRIFPSVDLDLPILERSEHCDRAIMYLSRNYPDIYKMWEFGMVESYFWNYASWLGELTSQNNAEKLQNP